MKKLSILAIVLCAFFVGLTVRINQGITDAGRAEAESTLNLGIYQLARQAPDALNAIKKRPYRGKYS